MKTRLLFLLFWLLAFALYYPVVDARFVFDYIDWHTDYETQGAVGLLHSFSDPSLHYIYHLAYFSLHKLFGLHGVLWLLVFTALHALNAALLFSFIGTWLKDVFGKNNTLVPLSAALLFLLSPYHTEVIAWGATIHYLMVTAMALGMLKAIQQPYINKRLPLIYTLFFVALFTHEMIVVLPVAIGVILLFAPLSVYTSRQNIVLKVVLPMLGLVAVWLLINKAILGQWVGHYGASTHLAFKVQDAVTAWGRYIAKYVFFAQFLPEKAKSIVYGAAENLVWMLPVVVVLKLAAIYLIFKKGISLSKLLMALLAAFSIAIVPVLNLYFPNWINIQADRLGYFASLFLYSGMSVLLFFVFRKYALLPVILLLAISIYTLGINVSSWRHAATVMQGLDVAYNPNACGTTYLLNLPDNYNGAYMYRCKSPNVFSENYRVRTGKTLSEQVVNIAGYNMQGVYDSVVVHKKDEHTYHVELDHWGNWWWRNTVGASNYETDLVKVEFDEYGHSYNVMFKHLDSCDRIMYQAGNRWVQIK